MSDQPDGSGTTATAITGTALRDTRWLAGGIWAGLLGALLVTSITAVDAFTQGSIASRYFAAVSNIGPGQGHSDDALAVTGLIVSGLAALALFGGWFAFVRATRAMLLAYADAGIGDDEAPAPAEWVTDESSADSTRTQVLRIVPADVVMYIGLAWAVIIVMPAILAAVEVWS